MLAIFLGLLTLAIVFVIFLAVALWKHPPIINISLPSSFVVQLQHKPAEAETREPTIEPIPEEILDYISFESEQHAQDARKRRVRMLKEETGSWDAAFRMLQKEDSSE